ncbi:GAF domain-containing protein [Candidatus Poribacteria bacterium]|nr:GAF domain-containing protein [Candidatus Poribacteria bacterium]
MDKKKLLADTPLFHKLRAEELDLIASVTEELIIKKKDYVYKQGEMGHAFYVIAGGQVELLIDNDDSNVNVIAHLTVGDHFGELSLLTGSPRSRSVRAIEDTVLLSLDKIVFDEILLENPRIHRLLDEALAERLRKASQNQNNITQKAEKSKQKKERELTFLNNLNMLAAADLSYEEIKEKIVELISNIFDADLSALYLGTEEKLTEHAFYGGINRNKNIIPKESMSPTSLIYKTMQLKTPLITDSSSIEKLKNIYSEYNAAIYIPLISVSDPKPFGVLVLYTIEPDFFNNEDEEIFRFLAPHIAQILINVKFYQESRRQRNELETLSRIGKELNASYDLPRLLYKIVELTASLIKASDVILRLKDEQEGILRIKSYFGITDDIANTTTQKIGEGIAGKVAKDGKPIISNDVKNDPNFTQNIPGTTRSVLCVPLLMKGNIIGTMSIYDKKINDEWQPFTEDDQRLLEIIASQASIAIENARIFSDRSAKVTNKNDLIKQSDFVGESRQADQIRSTINEYAANLRPVLLTGETGTGKSVLIISLLTILFLLIKHAAFLIAAHYMYTNYFSNSILHEKIIASLLFFSILMIIWFLYNIMCYLQSKHGQAFFNENINAFSYGLVPIVLGGYMAHYLEVFTGGALMMISGILALFHYKKDFSDLRILTPSATATLQTIMLVFALGLSIYSTYKIAERLNPKEESLFNKALIPISFVFIFGLILLFVM